MSEADRARRQRIVNRLEELLWKLGPPPEVTDLACGPDCQRCATQQPLPKPTKKPPSPGPGVPDW